MDITERVVNPAIAVALLLGTSTGTLQAAEWSFKPSVRVEATYTDNVDRVGDDKQGSVIGELEPGISMAGYGSAFTALLDYRANGVAYSDDSDYNTVFHNANLAAEYFVLPAWTLYGRGRFAQTAIDPQDNLSNDQLGRRGSLADYSNAILGTRLRAYQGDYIAGDADFAYRWVDAETNYQATRGYTAVVSLQEGDRVDSFFYSIDGTAAQERFDLGQSMDSRNIESVLGVHVIGDFGLFVRGSYDEDDSQIAADKSRFASVGGGVRWQPGQQAYLELGYNSVTQGDQDDYISARLYWQPSSRTAISGKIGRRIYGRSYALNASYGTRKLRSSLSYIDEVSSFSRQISGYDLAETDGDAQAEDDAGNNDGVMLLVPTSRIDNRVYLSKRWQYSSVLNTRYNMLRLTLHHEQREYEQLFSAEDETDYGAKLDWRLRLGQRTYYEMGGFYRELKDEIDDSKGREWSVDAGLVRRLMSKVSARLTLRHINDQGVSGGRSYRENRISLGLSGSL